MKPFLRKLFSVIALQVLIAAVLWWRYPIDEQTYVAATIDKHERLTSLTSPKLVLVGGSNVAMGLSAEQLSRALSLPAVNMGLHADLGRDFVLAEVRDAIGQGDIVVLSLEYQSFAADPSPITLAQLLEVHPQSVDFVPSTMLSHFTDDGLILIGQRARRAIVKRRAAKAPYSRASFNAMGDAVGHHGMPQRRPLAPFYFSGLTDDSIAVSIVHLQRFVDQVVSRGARIVYAYPPVPEQLFKKYRAQIDTIEGPLSSLQGVAFTNSPTSLPPNCFFDTAYHLTAECTRARTEQVASFLKGDAKLVP